MKNIAIFASGSGSNFQAFVDANEKGNFKANLSLLVCDKPGAYVIERAERAKINSYVFNPQDFATKAGYEEKILQQLQAAEIQFIVLAGYMRLIGPTLLKAYEGKIVNIHPSLLPAFPGKDAIGQALEANVKVSGVTIHYVDEGMDTGPIIEQESLRVRDDDTKESIQARIHKIEHKLYPAVVQKIIAEL